MVWYWTKSLGKEYLESKEEKWIQDHFLENSTVRWKRNSGQRGGENK